MHGNFLCSCIDHITTSSHIFWDEDSFKSIGDKLGHYIDRAKPKGNIFYYARIYLEIDFEKGLLEAIQINLEDWRHIQTLDYK
jgi:hypothetical protein